MTGWNMDGADETCEVCGRWAGECICPECPTCGSAGDLRCYAEHGLEFSNQQEISMAERRIEEAKLAIHTEEMYIEYLQGQSRGDK